jgi:hypothetical protein
MSTVAGDEKVARKKFCDFYHHDILSYVIVSISVIDEI